MVPLPQLLLHVPHLPTHSNPHPFLLSLTKSRHLKINKNKVKYRQTNKQIRTGQNKHRGKKESKKRQKKHM